MDTLRITINDHPEEIALPGERVWEVMRRQCKECNHLQYLIIKNDRFGSITEKITDHCSISTFDNFHESSRRAYETAAVIMLTYISEKCFPGRTLHFSHSMCDGIFCEYTGESKIEPADIKKLSDEFQSLVDQNMMFYPKLRGRVDAIKYFKAQGRDDLVDLLKYCSLNHIVLYTLGEKKYWTPSVCAPRTGLINVFEIMPYGKGFVLRLPLEGNPDSLGSFSNQERLYEIFNESVQWGKILGLNSISDVNRHIMDGDTGEIIKIAEALHEKKISSIADKIAAENKKLVFIAGPSSSGKTTFSKRLRIQLRVLGYKVELLSLDNYYKDRDVLREEQGDNLNFEVLEALDLKLLDQHIEDMINGKPVTIPRYDFASGKKTPGNKTVEIDEHTIILFEGIHGINPNLTPNIEDKYKFKIYISALTHLNFDHSFRIPTHDMRLIRRIVRDYRYRSYGAADTIKLWKKVVEGEKKYIFKYQGEADIMFNSSLAYEMNALKNYAEKILMMVPDENPSHPEAERLLDFLSYFLTIDMDEIPPTSILREFVGKSAFKY